MSGQAIHLPHCRDAALIDQGIGVRPAAPRLLASLRAAPQFDWTRAPWPEKDLEAPYDHERAAKEFLDAADRICSQAKVGVVPLDISVITAAQVNATIGVCEAFLAILQELRSRSKEEKKGSRSGEGNKPPASRHYQDPRGSEGRNL